MTYPGFDEAVQRLESLRGGKRDLKELPEHLRSGEAVRELAVCRYEGGAGVLALTDSRLLFVYDGWFRDTTVDVALSDVREIKADVDDGSTEIEIEADQPYGRVEYEFASVNGDDGRRLVTAARSALGHRR